MVNFKPKFSVVVPMYNVEAFLPRCVESICNQTLADIEIILVDDGSPDRCGEMADAYAVEDSRIKVVHRENGGLGPARNSGIEVAVGEYVGFVDSDDWVEPEMYEMLYDAAIAEDADIVYTGVKTVRCGKTDKVYEHPFSGRTFRGKDEIFELRRGLYGAPPARVKEEATPSSVCFAGYRRLLLSDHNLRFLAVRTEDKFFNTHACRAASVVTCITGVPYCYRKDDQLSITNTFNRKTIDSFFTLFRLLEQMADEEPERYWGEAHLREKRCVIDYTRVLIGLIEDSSEDDPIKDSFVREVLCHQALRNACEGYPWWRLPAQQAAFYLVLRSRLVRLARVLTRLKRRGM